jgi:hypothetical protein
MRHTTASAPTLNGTGGCLPRRNALTGLQLEMVISAAQRALSDEGRDITPSRVAKIVQRFTEALHGSRLGWCEFLEAKRNQRWLRGDPVLVRVVSYLDPTGEKAVNRVMRERGW